MFDLTDIGYVHRIVIGSTSPERLSPEAQVQEAADLLNRCLSERGRIIGMEKNFNLLNIGEHQVVLQNLVYHVGFARRPHWLGSAT
jgi:hypothetical protein